MNSPTSSFSRHLQPIMPSAYQVVHDWDETRVLHSYLGSIRDPNGQSLENSVAHAFSVQGKTEMEKTFEAQYGQKFNQYALSSEQRDWAKSFFYSNGNFQKAVETVRINPDDVSAITLPWWTERIGVEVDWQINSRGANASIVESHSYLNQIARARKIIHPSISLVGIVQTLPGQINGKIFPDGAVIVGIRGGNFFPNTYHVSPAGALCVREELVDGSWSVGQTLVRTELKEELCIDEIEVISTKFHSRFIDTVNNGPVYLFKLNVNLTPDEVLGRWKANKDPDKGEHRGLVFVPATRLGAETFLKETFFGAVTNDIDRANHQRVSLPPCAVALALAFGIEGSFVEELAKRES